MKCPYAVNVQQYTQSVNEYDEEGNLVNESTMMLEFHPFAECPEMECAAWQDGRCQYKGAVP